MRPRRPATKLELVPPQPPQLAVSAPKDVLEGFAEAIVEQFDDTARLRGKIDALLDTIKIEGARILAQHAAFELPGAIERAVRLRLRHLALMHAVVLLVVLLAGFCAGWAFARYGRG